MKVILLADGRLGKKGATVTVSDGYATNYLIPHGLAVISTTESQHNLAKETANTLAHEKDLKAKAEKVAERLNSLNVEFKAKVGADGKMFGAVSPKQIEDGLKQQWDIEIDKRKFIDKYPANALGYTRLRIYLYKGIAGEVIATVNVHISEDK